MNKPTKQSLGVRALKQIDALVNCYLESENQDLAKMALLSIVGYINESTKLNPYIHTVKQRLKDSSHLRNKLIRKYLEAESNGGKFDITTDNLFLKINDLVGIRIIHLHTRQIEDIDKYLKQILASTQVEIIEGPKARIWDSESEDYFRSIGFDVMANSNMYTSVHYVVKPSPLITCEIQVRTLMEEVWGEVDHTINYPKKSDSLSCREQIKTLARVTSSCSRLVDSIFATHHDYESSSASKVKQITKRKGLKDT